MGWWSVAWEGIKRFGTVVSTVAQKAWEFANSPNTKDLYEKVESVLSDHSAQFLQRSSDGTGAPDFFSASGTSSGKELKKLRRDVALQQEQMEYLSRLTAVQIELSRLRGSAELIDRSKSQIRIHASHLSNHFEQMRNTNGLIDDGNAYRTALYAIMKNFNHNMNILGQEAGSKDLKKIEGVDIEIKRGAISRVGAFDAFDRTRRLLSEEINELARLAKEHRVDLKKVKRDAGSLEPEIASQIVQFIDDKIMNVIDDAESASYALGRHLDQLPAAERDDSGELIFEGGNLKMTNNILDA